MIEDRKGEGRGLLRHETPKEGKYGTHTQSFSQYRKEGISNQIFKGIA